VLIDGEGRASICDFGLSIILDGGPTGYTSSNFGGSLRFLAPELLDENTRTVQTDIYAYACTCIEVRSILARRHALYLACNPLFVADLV
jgi:serine/threonine protein kinase